MTDLFEVARSKQQDFLREAEQEKWLRDARSKGYTTTGRISRAAKAAISRLVSITAA